MSAMALTSASRSELFFFTDEEVLQDLVAQLQRLVHGVDALRLGLQLIEHVEAAFGLLDLVGQQAVPHVLFLQDLAAAAGKKRFHELPASGQQVALRSKDKHSLVRSHLHLPMVLSDRLRAGGDKE